MQAFCNQVGPTPSDVVVEDRDRPARAANIPVHRDVACTATVSTASHAAATFGRKRATYVCDTSAGIMQCAARLVQSVHRLVRRSGACGGGVRRAAAGHGCGYVAGDANWIVAGAAWGSRAR
jgi:hypothetical protein